MAFYEKDGIRVPENQAFDFALDKLMTGDICEQDDFVDWFFQPLMGWHFYEDEDETESIEAVTQSHTDGEIRFLRKL